MSITSEKNKNLIPSCTVIIPTRDRRDLLQPCVESVLRTSFSGGLEVIIVDNASTDTDALQYLADVQADDRVTVIHWDRAFNFSEINNMAAQHARGDVLCFLNNDVEVKTPQWLEILAPVANMDDVGAVGALLLYADNTVQHAGVALDKNRVAAHIAHTRSLQQLEHDYRLDCWYGVEAVTAACLLTRRQLFLDAGGFDEKDLAVSFNDVDYCLRLRDFGYPSVILPSVQLYHYESMTRKSDDLPENRRRAQKERQVMLDRWHKWLDQASFNAEPDWRRASSGTHKQIPLAEQIAAIKNSLDRSRPVSAGMPANAVNDELHLLQMKYYALEAHARALEKELAIVYTSRSWLVTAPARRILSALRQLKQNAGKALVSTAIGRRLYSLRSASRIHVAAQSPAADPDAVKKHYADSARQQFDDFLAAGKPLVLPRSAQPEVSILLVLFNQAHLTLLCLKSLVEHCDIDAEVIIVDNNSTDKSAELMSLVKGAELIKNTTNAGFVHAVNQGAAVATGKHLLLLNNDALLLPGSLRAALNVFDSEQNVGAVGGKITLLDQTLQEAGSIIWQDGSCLGYGRGQNPRQPEFMFRREVDYCSGAFLMTPRALFNALGGFDTDYAPAYYEESDYCIRLKKAGYRIVYEPDAAIIHYEFASSGGFAGANKLQQEHRKILCAKHPEFLAAQYPYAPENVLKARSSSRHARVLVIDDRVPHTSLGTGYPRCREILHELSAFGLQVTLYPLCTPDDDWHATYQSLPADTEVMLDHGKDGLAEFLRQRRGFYHYIMISRSHNMEWFNFVIARDPTLTEGARIIYDAEALVAPREAARLRLNGQNIPVLLERKMVNAELELARNADCVIAVSQSEAEVYRKAAFSNLAVLAHKTQLNPTPKTFAERKDLLFVGALRDDNSPNVDSLIWFCNEIWPIVKQALGHNIQLFVAGENTAPLLRKLSAQGVQFLGRQQDIRPLYDRCRVFVAPTRFAAGIPHKVHEAASCGIPVVATPLLAQQLSWGHGEQLLAAESAAGFAECCVELYTTESTWQSVRNSALAALAHDCSPQVFRDTIRSLFSDWPVAEQPVHNQVINR